MPSPLAHYEGRIQPLEDVRVPALDRGFLFGDGVYEVLRIYAGRPWLEAEHFARMLTAPEAKEAFTAFFEKRKADFNRKSDSATAA